MRILFTADPELPVPPGAYGGVQRLVAQWIGEFRKRGDKVALIGRPGSQVSCDEFFPWPGLRSHSLIDTGCNARALLRAARFFRADVIHSSSRLLYTWPSLLAQIPVVMTYHRVPGHRQIALARRLGHKLVFTGVSRFITERGRKGGGIWHTVPNCVDLDQLAFRAHTSPDAPVVFLSRIEADKGAHLAIAIARRAGQPLVLAGNHSADVEAARYWREQIEPKIDGQLIRYVGPVDDEQKSALLGNARALLVPTQCEEAFGLVFAEALACGTPAIGTFRGAVPEVIEHGKTGWLISNEDEGVAALANIASLSRQACRRAAEERFSIPVAASSYQKTYQEVLAS